MAKPHKPGTTRTTRAKVGAKLKSESPAAGAIEDAEIVEEAPKETVAADATVTEDAVLEAEKAEAVEPETPEADVEAPKKADTESDEARVDEPEITADPVSQEPDPDFVIVDTPEAEDASKAQEPSPRSMDVPQTVAVVPAPPEPRASFVPMVLGGVVAALLGAGALIYSNSNGWIDLGGTDVAPLETKIAAQSTEIADLKTTLATAQSEIEALRVADTAIDGVNEKIDAITAVVDGLSKATVTLGGQLEATNERLAEVATQPIPEARLPEKVTNAYEAKFAEFAAALQTEQDTKLAAVEARLTVSLADMEAVQSAAMQAEQAAMDATAAAKTRAALADIEIAMDTGTGFGPALEALTETSKTEVPGALAGAADGSIPTLSQLQSGFPDVARAALVASTHAGAQDGSVSGLTAFFRTQLGARSLEPREGDDPDAVLSRAEAAVSRGDLDAALAEFALLPEDGQAALADWKTAAETRIEAKAALAALSDQLNSN